MRLRIIVAAALIGLGAVSWAQIAEPPDVAGVYTVAGMGPQGAYDGGAEIYQKGKAVAVRWMLSSGTQYLGFGLLDGDTMVVGWAAGDAGFGALYKRRGAEWVGEWPDHEGKLWGEVLTRRVETLAGR